MKSLALIFVLSVPAFASEDFTPDKKLMSLVYAKNCSFTPGATITSCYCDNQNFAVGGGTYAPANAYIRYNYPTGNNGWRVGCVDVLSGAPADCNNVYVKCMVAE